MVVFLELITIMMGMLINNDNDLVSFSGISDSLLATIGSVTREGRRPPGHYNVKRPPIQVIINYVQLHQNLVA